MDRITPGRQENIEKAADQATELTKGKNGLLYGAAIRQAAEYWEVSTTEVSQELNHRKKLKGKPRQTD